MAMVIHKTEENTQKLLQTSNQMRTETIWQKIQKGNNLQKNGEETVIGKAAEVFISKEGKKLFNDSMDPLKKLTQTDFMTEGEKNLEELLVKKDERQEFIKQADELEERLDNNADLTDDEKEVIERDIDKLREKGKSPEEKLHESYQKKFALEEKLTSDKELIVPEEQEMWDAYAQKQLFLADRDIFSAKNEIAIEGALQQAYSVQALKERADIAVAKNRADYLGKEIDFRSSELSMSIRTEDQIHAQTEENGKYQPTAVDVIKAATDEVKQNANYAEDDIEQLQNGGLDLAIAMQNKTVVLMDSANAYETEKLTHIEIPDKLTVEDALA